jgi:hypothetical protein
VINWTPELEEAICSRIAAGESVLSISKDPAIPSQDSIYRRIINDSAFSEKYARAREAQMELMSAEILEIADDSSRDTKTGPEGGEYPDNEWISRSKLRVDTRKWLMSKLAPKKYGDRVQNEHTGADGGPIQFVTKSILEEKE